MNCDNNANRIRRKLLIEVARLQLKDRLEDNIDRLPLALFPRQGTDIRCCVYKDRAITKYRLMAIMGHGVEKETNELKPLSDYARESLQRAAPAPDHSVLTVIDEACSACTRARHYVTNVCRGCVARPCMINCPKDAIQIVDSRAVIDGEKCVDCGKCLKVCPYHAIVHIPVPCEENCPVGAIFKDETGREQIDYDKCIFCGNCLQECPFGAIMECSQIVDVIQKIKQGHHVIAMIAPALAGQFPVEYDRLLSAVLKLGFHQVVEVAAGADIAAEHESRELQEKIAAGQPFMTTSCCPAYLQAVDKHMPELRPYVSSTFTPLHYSAERVKQEHPDGITVFIGPCVAKRQEALHDRYVDYVLTSEEIGAMFVAADIEIADCEPFVMDSPSGNNGRGFALIGGPTHAVMALTESKDIQSTLIDGLDKKSIRLLKTYAKGKCPYNFIEVMSCQGGCVSGPCNITNPRSAEAKIRKIIEKPTLPAPKV